MVERRLDGSNGLGGTGREIMLDGGWADFGDPGFESKYECIAYFAAIKKDRLAELAHRYGL